MAECVVHDLRCRASSPTVVPIVLMVVVLFVVVVPALQRCNDCFEFHEGANEFMVEWRAWVCPRRLDDFERPRSSLGLVSWKIYRNPSVIEKIITMCIIR